MVAVCVARLAYVAPCRVAAAREVTKVITMNDVTTLLANPAFQAIMANVTKAYGNELPRPWPTKMAGIMPTAAELAIAQCLGIRSPGKYCLGVAMSLRGDGTTSPQMIAAVGDPKHNVRTALMRSGYLRVDDSQRTGNGNYKVYRSTLTAKGVAKVLRKAASVAAEMQPPAPKAAAKRPAAKPQATPPVEAKPAATLVAGTPPKATNGHGKPAVTPPKAQGAPTVPPKAAPQPPASK